MAIASGYSARLTTSIGADMDKKTAIGAYARKKWGAGAVIPWREIDGIEMERLRLLAMSPDHPHAVFLFTVERSKDKHR